MTDYTAAEIQDAVNETDFFEWNYEDTIILRGEHVDIEWLESTGGMDEGSYASAIFKIGTQTFRKEGYYASHYGYDWDGDLEEVETYEKTVTAWRAV